jgi:vacuolar-type H+-ATPase subunit I/STV1
MTTTTRKSDLSGLNVEDILNEELRREMGLDSDPATGRAKLQQRFSQINQWEDIMHSVYELPIELEGYTNRVADLVTLKEIVDKLASQDYDNVKRSESRKKQLKEFVKTMNMYYNVIFTKGDEKVGYGVLIYFPDLNKEDAERSSGIVLVEKKSMKGDNPNSEMRFERAKFDDFLIEVRPYIEIIGDLYRRDKASEES